MLNRLRHSAFFAPLVKILTLLGLIAFFYYFLRLWYHGLAYDPGFLDFTASVATLVALIPLLGLQTEWGRDVARGLGQMIPLNRWLPSPESKCLALWLLVALMVGGLHWGYPYLAHEANVRGAQALQLEPMACDLPLNQAQQISPLPPEMIKKGGRGLFFCVNRLIGPGSQGSRWVSELAKASLWITLVLLMKNIKPLN